MWSLKMLLTRHQMVSYDQSVTKCCPIRGSTKYLGEGVVSENNQLRDVFDAIADPTRRRLIRLLAEAEEKPLHELTAQFQMGRTAVSKHLTILKEAGLVHDRKVGRETRFRLNASPLREIQDWVAFYSKFWSTNMLRLNQLLEEEEE
jgi:DNA-binding transcriptional ArsR family regulator